MPHQKQPAEAVARPAGPEYFADGDTARVLIPRQTGKGHHIVELRRNCDSSDVKRAWLARFNSSPEFSIAEHRLRRVKSFQNVLEARIDGLRGEIQLILDVNDLPHQVAWRIIVERLIATLLELGGDK
ncbi:hypothetical protein JQ615_21470 [Bradyrhizobium jicamae]|uniref:Uncharacterized protein n=1 Tax=Bradyrhizobium jicamae TaxID=280332 RepID=A0ABS5FMF0_9BRAD|nr:hypothetical protein [Bradyrhizobium jicamae]MBR0797963.1 hypothetical protein [Bradyrhizobium jicamae]